MKRFCFQKNTNNNYRSNQNRPSIKNHLIGLLSIVTLIISCSAKPNDTIISIETNYGKILLRLYPETQKHKQNFIKLVESGFYDSLLFHRVIERFMIQGGDPISKKARAEVLLGDGDVGYTIPAEFMVPKYYHKRGVLAAAREGDNVNPTKASSGCQFYIVQGRTFTDSGLDSLQENRLISIKNQWFREIATIRMAEIKTWREQKNEKKLTELNDSILKIVDAKIKANPNSYKYTQDERETYKTVGGTPHLDGNYTVFGEVVEGMDIVDKIAHAGTDKNNRPLEEVRILKAKVIHK